MVKPLVFFTSDNHFGHANIIKHCERPYENVTVMDLSMIQRWNSAVRSGDIIYHLGDFTLEGPEVARGLFERLNGNIRILSYTWHHDRHWLKELVNDPPTSQTGEKVEFLPPMVVMRTTYNATMVPTTLCHYPLHSWEQQHRGAWMLYGHSHKKLDLGKGALHVGVDTNSFRPVSINIVKSRLGSTIYNVMQKMDNAKPPDSKPAKDKDELMYT